MVFLVKLSPVFLGEKGHGVEEGKQFCLLNNIAVECELWDKMASKVTRLKGCHWGPSHVIPCSEINSEEKQQPAAWQHPDGPRLICRTVNTAGLVLTA